GQDCGVGHQAGGRTAVRDPIRRLQLWLSPPAESAPVPGCAGPASPADAWEPPRGVLHARLFRRGERRVVAEVSKAADWRQTSPAPDPPDVKGRYHGRWTRPGHRGRYATRLDSLAAPFECLPPLCLGYLVPTSGASSVS